MKMKGRFQKSHIVAQPISQCYEDNYNGFLKNSLLRLYLFLDNHIKGYDKGRFLKNIGKTPKISDRYRIVTQPVYQCYKEYSEGILKNSIFRLYLFI